MRYKITIIPFLNDVHITVTGYPEELGALAKVPQTFVMTSDDGETEYLYSILSFLAGEIASYQH